MISTSGKQPTLAQPGEARHPSSVSANLLDAGRRTADRVNGWLLLAHLPVACLLAAIYGSWPVALVVGATLSGGSFLLTRWRPGQPSTRIAVGVSYMLYSALFIQLAHGLTELHFHVFAALAMLLIYRDWRLPLVAAVVIAAQHSLFLYLQQTMSNVHVMAHAMSGVQSLNMLGVHVVFVLFESAILSSMAWRLEIEAQQTEDIFRTLGELGWQGKPNAAGDNVAEAQRTVVDAIRALEACSAELESAVLEQRAMDLAPSPALYGAFLSVATQMRSAASCVESLRLEADAASERLRASNHELALEIERVNALTDRAEAATYAKSSFLANMSHEIRTPLTAILGYTEIVKTESRGDDPLSTRAMALDTIQRAGDHLLAVINDILDLSKLDSGKLVVEHIDTSLAQLLFDIDSLMRAKAVAKGLTLRTTLFAPIPERIRTDQTRLRQILLNLAGNAIKFTEHGQVEIAVGVRAVNGDNLLRIEVRDSGSGISPEQAARLFQPFTQADVSVTRRHGGTGLGLSISKRLAELLGGAVWLESSAIGTGSCFVLELPLVADIGTGQLTSFDVCAGQVGNNATVADTSGALTLTGRILLAEDGEDNQRLIAHHLRKAGAEVSVVENGRIALDLLDATQGTERAFDMLVTDMQMPELDGYSLATAIRARGWSIPIVALTAHAMTEDRERCLQAGCDDYCSKPINRDVLLRTCRRWMTTRSEPAALRSEFADDPMMRELVGEFASRLTARSASLRAHWQARDRAALAVDAHKLKGAAGGYGFPSISLAASQLETSLHNTLDDGAIAAVLDELDSLCRAAALTDSRAA